MKPEVAPDAPLSRLWVVPMLALATLVILGLQAFAPFAVAEAAGICSAVLFIVVVAIWASHREKWFWPFVGATIVIEGLGISLIPWPRNHTFEKSDLLFFWVDFALLWAALIIIGRVTAMREKRSGS